MTTTHRLPAVTAVALAAALTPAATARAADLPANSRAGVTLTASKKAVKFTFSAAAASTYRQIAGRVVSVSCTAVENDPLGLTANGDTTQQLRAPKRGRVLRSGALTRGTDFCTISSTERKRRKGGQIQVELASPIISVPLTAQGAIYVEESEVAGTVGAASTAAAAYALRHRNRYPTFAQLKAAYAKAKVRFALSALPNAAATPPPGTVGYVLTGTTATTVGITRTGRRLYIEVAPDGRLSTNVANYLFGSN